jgi:hypothetical protein
MHMSAISIEPASLTIPEEVVKIHDIANRYREEVSRHNEAILALMAEESSARNGCSKTLTPRGLAVLAQSGKEGRVTRLAISPLK